MLSFHLLFLYGLPGPTNIRTLTSDPVRGLIANVTKPPNAFIPAPLLQKEAPTGYSYQQINCLDSIIRWVFVLKTILSHHIFSTYCSSFDTLHRYLDSCNIPNTVKRKCGSSSCTSTSDEDKQQEANGNKGT